MSEFEEDEILEGFLEEAREHLAQIEEDLVVLEQNDPSDKANTPLIDNLFRSLHTIKGGSGFFSHLEKVKILSHAQENIMSLVRSGKLDLSIEITGPLLKSVDLLAKMLNNPETALDVDISSDLKKLHLIESMEKEKVVVEKNSSEEKLPLPETISAVSANNAGTASLRVKVSTLDNLMKLAGELVLTRNRLLQVANKSTDPDLQSIVQELDGVTSSVQVSVMDTRMQPISVIFNKFTRIVRDLALQCGKKVNLKITGKDVELDKSVLETIGDPLIHMVRNSIDHGIEDPETRIGLGKDPIGTLQLVAYHQAGQVVIEIIDDGKGIDPNKVREKALQSGNFSQSKLDLLSDKDVISLIMQAGFSLAEKVSDLSGRGVGMDVVASNLSEIGGSISIESKVGTGSKMQIKLPLTLAILPCLTVVCAKQNYFVPQANIVELLCVDKHTCSAIHCVAGQFLLEHRDYLIPLISLHEVLGIETSAIPLAEFAGAQSNEELEKILKEENINSVYILVVSVGHFSYGIVVDAFLGSEETVVKSLSRFLKLTPCFAGTTIQGDGKVGTVLDIGGISRYMKLETIDTSEFNDNSSVLSETDTEYTESCFVFRHSKDDMYCCPRNLVEKIICIPKSDIHLQAGVLSAIYQDEIFPIMSLHEAIDVGEFEYSEDVFLFIFVVAGQHVGLLTSEIIGIENVPVDIKFDHFTPEGALNSVIVYDELARVLDIFTLCHSAHPEWFKRVNEEKAANQTLPKKLLVAEDSLFYQNQYKRIFNEWNISYVMAEDGVEALKILRESEEGEEFDLLLTDIVMPNMDGLELTREVRKDPRFKDLPIMGVSTLSSEEDKKAAMEAGVDDYLVKLDIENLLIIMAALSGSTHSNLTKG